MSITKPTIYIIKGTDNVAEFRQNGVSGWYKGNTNIDHRIDQNAFELRGLFINPSAFQHMDKLLAQSNGLLFNSITDPDVNPLCLANLNKALKSNPHPVINHPRLVMQTRRDNVAKVLAGMDGLIVPKTIRVNNHRLSELISNIAAARMRYPLLVRSIAAHNQEHLLKIDGPSHLPAAAKLPGKGWYVTEFHDYRSADGLYRSYRFFIFATGTIVARNIDIGPDWKVGVHVRESFMIHRDDLLKEVSDYVDDYAPIVGNSRLTLMQKIRERLGLDYIGMDCNLLPSGELLLFETNVAMNADARRHSSGKFGHFEVSRSRLIEAFTGLLHARMS